MTKKENENTQTYIQTYTSPQSVSTCYASKYWVYQLINRYSHVHNHSQAIVTIITSIPVPAIVSESSLCCYGSDCGSRHQQLCPLHTFDDSSILADELFSLIAFVTVTLVPARSFWSETPLTLTLTPLGHISHYPTTHKMNNHVIYYFFCKS